MSRYRIWKSEIIIKISLRRKTYLIIINRNVIEILAVFGYFAFVGDAHLNRILPDLSCVGIF